MTGYRIYRNGQAVATIGPGTSYSDTVPPGDYTYVVRALDAADHESGPSNAADVTVPDIEDPTAPQNLTATVVSPSQIDLAWEAVVGQRCGDELPDLPGRRPADDHRPGDGLHGQRDRSRDAQV